MTNLDRLVQQDRKLQAEIDAAVTTGKFRFTEKELLGFAGGQRVANLFMQQMGDSRIVPGANMLYSGHEETLIEGIKESLTDDLFLTVSGLVQAEHDKRPGTADGTSAMPFFAGSGVKPGMETPIEYAADLAMAIAVKELGLRHTLMQLMSGREMSFRAMHAIVNVYRVNSRLERVQTTGLAVSLTKGDCILCAGPEKLTFVTIPSHLLAPYLPAVDREGNVPGMEAERREATYLRAIASLGARELN